MTKKKVVEQAEAWPELVIGQKVLFKGIECVITEVRSDGYVEARNPTLHALALAEHFKPL